MCFCPADELYPKLDYMVSQLYALLGVSTVSELGDTQLAAVPLSESCCSPPLADGFLFFLLSSVQLDAIVPSVRTLLTPASTRFGLGGSIGIGTGVGHAGAGSHGPMASSSSSVRGVTGSAHTSPALSAISDFSTVSASATQATQQRRTPSAPSAAADSTSLYDTGRPSPFRPVSHAAADEQEGGNSAPNLASYAPATAGSMASARQQRRDAGSEEDAAIDRMLLGGH